MLCIIGPVKMAKNRGHGGAESRILTIRFPAIRPSANERAASPDSECESWLQKVQRIIAHGLGTFGQNARTSQELRDDYVFLSRRPMK